MIVVALATENFDFRLKKIKEKQKYVGFLKI